MTNDDNKLTACLVQLCLDLDPHDSDTLLLRVQVDLPAAESIVAQAALVTASLESVRERALDLLAQREIDRVLRARTN